MIGKDSREFPRTVQVCLIGDYFGFTLDELPDDFGNAQTLAPGAL